jgi:hypothetical protein
MSERIHVLAQQLFGKSSIDECDLQEIKNLADRYPYFAPAQFLLLEKLKKENAPGYSAQLQKAVLYYHDPLEFEYFVSPDRFETEVNFEEVDQPSETDFTQEEDIAREIPPVSKEETELTPQDDVVVEEEGADTGAEEEVSTADEQKMEASIERVLQQEEKQIDQAANNNDMVFEPYHTVDYFASQGIKLSQEETSKDKFGKQLKSFTEWLKTMKRLPAKEMAKEMDPSTETKVQHLAEDSVHQSDVVTEAMAEVWIKQGNKEKAIETYNKLGLLNPSKKAYFAGLIENLKRS